MEPIAPLATFSFDLAVIAGFGRCGQRAGE
jgi:hypothetical protein